ncbi:MAG: class I mannose-6-phosphate isomerase [Bacteroidaceae bacterium]|nr:class I mannose-6-phosphate isomerase [Bacteroidaceae bacterium]
MSKIPLLKFAPILKEKPWGGSLLAQMKGMEAGTGKIGETWEISAYPGDISTVDGGYYQGKTLTELVTTLQGALVGHKVYATYGDLFPLLFKFIHSEDDLSLQVHPGDQLAQQRGMPFGKTEMWYVYQSQENAMLYSGFNQPVTQRQYLESIAQDQLSTLLQPWPTHAGDTFFIPAGTVHALCKGNIVIEVQQTSDTTYRLYDYNRKGLDGKLRPLHIEESLQAVNYHAPRSKVDYTPVKEGKVQLVSCPYFVTSLYHLTRPTAIDFSPLDSFVVFIAIEGQAEISADATESQPLHSGHSLLLPANNCQVEIRPQSPAFRFLEVHCP